jgi:hypothetical protein
MRLEGTKTAVRKARRLLDEASEATSHARCKARAETLEIRSAQTKCGCRCQSTLGECLEAALRELLRLLIEASENAAATGWYPDAEPSVVLPACHQQLSATKSALSR